MDPLKYKMDNFVTIFGNDVFSKHLFPMVSYTQNTHKIPISSNPPFNIATQSATYTVTACVSRWEPNVLNANNPCPAARQKQYWYFISLLRFSALKCKPNGQKNVVVLENLIIESLHMIETEFISLFVHQTERVSTGYLKNQCFVC